MIVGIVVVLAIAAVGFFAIPRGSGKTPTTTQSAQFTVGERAPDFTLKDFSGNDVSLSQFYGQKAVVLDFWAAWCPFCVEEMKELERVHKEFGDRLVMIGVHRTDSGENIEVGKQFAQEQGVTYLLFQGTNEIYRASTRGVTGMPVAVFIDKGGVVRDVKIGPKTAEEIKAKVEVLLE